MVLLLSFSYRHGLARRESDLFHRHEVCAFVGREAGGELKKGARMRYRLLRMQLLRR
jgi:hypothetical protein